MLLETIVLVLGVSSVVTYETTGKGLADHAVSTVANQDCKIARVVKGDKICQPESSVTVSSPSEPTVIKSTAVQDMERVFAQRKAQK
jgi:hypothetical protein